MQSWLYLWILPEVKQSNITVGMGAGRGTAHLMTTHMDLMGLASWQKDVVEES